MEENKNNYEPGSKTIKDVYDMCCELMGLSSVTQLLRNQVNDLILVNHFTPLEIMRCLSYADENAHANFNPVYGIKSTVLSVREPAAKYFEKLIQENKRREQEADRIIKFQNDSIVINISKIQHKPCKKKFLDISQIDVEEDKD